MLFDDFSHSQVDEMTEVENGGWYELREAVVNRQADIVEEAQMVASC